MTMKNYIVIFMLGLFFINTGCMKIDVTPENSITFENFFREEKDFEVFLNSIKYNFKVEMTAAEANLQVKKGFYADEIYDYTIEWARMLEFGIVHTPGTMQLFWDDHYKIIAGCNILLENLDKATFSKEKIAYYAAQAYFYRGYVYYTLAIDYGEAPISLESRKLERKAKSSTQELLSQAVSDFENAMNGLPAYKDLTDETGKATTRRDLLCKETVYASLGYLYAWEASILKKPDSYTKAIDALTMVLKQTDCYDLAATPEEVCTQVLKGTNHKESIFEIRMNWDLNGKTQATTPAKYLTGFPICPTYTEGDIAWMDIEIFNSTVDWMFPKGDLRRESYFYKTDEYRTDEWLEITYDYAFPYKFRDVLLQTTGISVGEVLSFGSAKVFYRVADLLLLRAECYARSGQDGLAIADLNRVRARAQAKLYGTMEEPGDLRYTIFKEREKELLWECFRYYDAIRNDYYDEISETYGNLTEDDVKNGAIYLPVPQGAFEQNPLMLQNKYWLSKY